MSTSRLLRYAVALLLYTASFAVWAQANEQPSPYAGPDQLVSPGAFVTLNGSDIYNEEFEPYTLTWEQVLGEPVTLSETIFSCFNANNSSGSNVQTCSPGSPNPTFTAPATPQTMRFKLTAADVVNTDNFYHYSDFVDVVVLSVPEPAAVWMFGGGLLTLLGVARYRKQSA